MFAKQSEWNRNCYVVLENLKQAEIVHGNGGKLFKSLTLKIIMKVSHDKLFLEFSFWISLCFVN